MMEALSSVASIIHVVQISSQILTLCREYYSAAKNARTEIERLRSEVVALQSVLEKLQEAREGPTATRLFASNSLDKQIKQCLSELEDFRKRLASGKGRKIVRRFRHQSLKWPVTGEEVDNTIRVLERFKMTFGNALNEEQM